MGLITNDKPSSAVLMGMPTNDKPSIAELQQLEHLETRQAKLLNAAPVLLEIAVAALAARDAICTCRTDDSAHHVWCGVLAADIRLTDALAKVRP